ncbi:unnamed protein product [Adineta ricciae]|uniref:Uncharacterized protein n=1 Tax=Adineta ricciae TaxID=249248 RepID=A0A815T198_ADIRI|nr:unnamed protein product [Adineta ricciae]CAF1531065.1 unnamed protein product [Adineta ricciae]
MNTPVVGLAAPRLVHSCTIRNNSNGPVRVQILYKGPSAHGRGDHQEISTADIPSGGSFRAEERVTNHGSYTTRKEIAGIKVARYNGQKQKLYAPFQGVHSVELNWLFVIDDWQIYSVNPNRTMGQF